MQCDILVKETTLCYAVATFLEITEVTQVSETTNPIFSPFVNLLNLQSAYVLWRINTITIL